MAVSGTPITVCYYAWDTVNNTGKTGDVSNHTLRLDRDGSSVTPSGSPVEVDATNCPGLYRLALTSTEHTGHSFTLHGTSATSGVVIIPTAWTTENGTAATATDAALAAKSAAEALPSVTEIDTQLSSTHGVGSWEGVYGLTKQDVADALSLAPIEEPAAKSVNARLAAVHAVAAGSAAVTDSPQSVAYKDEDGETAVTHTFDGNKNRTAT